MYKHRTKCTQLVSTSTVQTATLFHPKDLDWGIHECGLTYIWGKSVQWMTL